MRKEYRRDERIRNLFVLIGRSRGHHGYVVRNVVAVVVHLLRHHLGPHLVKLIPVDIRQLLEFLEFLSLIRLQNQWIYSQSQFICISNLL